MNLSKIYYSKSTQKRIKCHSFCLSEPDERYFFAMHISAEVYPNHHGLILPICVSLERFLMSKYFKGNNTVKNRTFRIIGQK